MRVARAPLESMGTAVENLVHDIRGFLLYKEASLLRQTAKKWDRGCSGRPSVDLLVLFLAVRSQKQEGDPNVWDRDYMGRIHSVMSHS